VRRAIQKALAEQAAESGLTQSDIARAIGVHRSVINRELRGKKDLTLGRVAELSWALGRDIIFDLKKPETVHGQNNLPLNCFVSPSTGSAPAKDVTFISSETPTGSNAGSKVAA
jgi:transcriptional regulator with XRE-family HTH domain